MTLADSSIIILGAAGMLGSDLVSLCKAKGLNFKAFDLPEFDITDLEQLNRVVAPAQIVINCAAYTNVEKAESETQLAYKVNAEAVGHLARIAGENNIHLLHISTDFVFDGQLDRPYKETDPTNPISAYGRTKLQGEQLLAESNCSSTIIRIQWTYGLNGNNFVKKIVKLAKTRDTLSVVDDQVGAPTPTTAIATAIIEMLDRDRIAEGLFHFAAAGSVSRFEMAQFIADKLNLPVEINPCKTSDFPTAAARPLNSRFDCSKIEILLAGPIGNWHDNLENFLEQL